MSKLYAELRATADVRKAAMASELEDMYNLANVYEGELPAEFREFFPKNTPRHEVNFIGLAWDDLAQTVARAPEVQVDPVNLSKTSIRKAAKLEKIVTGYFQDARPFDSAFLFTNAWNLVGLGKFVAIVVPDGKNKTPRFEARDPRNCFPGAKRRIGSYIDELSDLIFETKMKRTEAVKLGLAKGTDKDGKLIQSDVIIYEYLDDKVWAQVGPDGQKIAKHGLGLIPGVYRSTFSPNKTGKSQFKEQISLMVAVSRIITQKIAYLDRVIYPITWVKGLTGELTLGPNAVATLSEHGSIGQLSPPANIQVDRDLNTLEKYQRILNRNPEVRQGEVDGKGAYVGAKTLDTLSDSVDNSVARFWDAMQAGYQDLVAIGLEMDEALYSRNSKSISVIIKGQRNVEEYTPEKDINGRRGVRVAYGFGVGGSYQSFLENVQAWQGELKPKRMAIESMPGGNDAERIMRELDLDKIDNVAMEGFLAQAQNGQLDMVLWAKFRTKMEEDGLSWYEAAIEYEEAFAQQAGQAAAQPVPETGMTQPPAAAAVPEQALPGLPPTSMLGA
ncbi:hypothetical protein LCGC14_1182920 [marine sediment metagenome]|uniref:Portal protein n=1 Tax=marine sediment metagenome TaxID=412755 RepID=A0A0F9LLP9_9ZZZZ